MVSGGLHEEFKDTDHCTCTVQFKFVILSLDYLMAPGLCTAVISFCSTAKLFELLPFKHVM